MSHQNPIEQIQNSGPRAEDSLFILGPIDSWMELNGRRLYKKLQRSDRREVLQIYLSTPGGDVKTADEIYQVLRSYPAPVQINIFGECSSAGTLISSAAIGEGSSVRMARSAWFMIHRASMYAWGNSDDMRSAIKLLEIADDAAIEKYKLKVGNRLSRERLRNLLQTDYYMSAEEARKLGFIDEVVDYIELPFDFETEASGLGYDYSDYYWDFWMKRAIPDDVDKESDAYQAIQEYLYNLKSQSIEQRLIENGHRRIPDNFTQKDETMSKSTMAVIMSSLGLASSFKERGLKLVDKDGKEVEDFAPFEEAILKQQNEALSNLRKELEDQIATTLTAASNSAEAKAKELMQQATQSMDEYRTNMDAKVKDLADKVGGILTQKSGGSENADESQSHKPAKGDEKLSDTEINQLKMMVRFVRQGKFSEAQFKNMTGRTFQQSVDLVG